MRSSHFIPFALGTLFAAVACSDDEPMSDPTPPASGGNTMGTGGAVTGTGGSTTPASGGGSGATTATGGGTTTGGAGTETGGSMGLTPDTDEFGMGTDEAGIDIGLAVYDYTDAEGSTFNTTNPMAGQICTDGFAAEVIDVDGDGELDYGAVWGGAVAISAAEEGETEDLTGCTGFTYDIDTPPSSIRIGVQMDMPAEVTYFTTTVAAGTNMVLFEDLEVGSWVEDAPDLDLTRIKEISWSIPSSDSGAVDFDFCLSNIQMIGDCMPASWEDDGTGGSGSGGAAGTGGGASTGGAGSGGASTGGAGSGGASTGGASTGGASTGGAGEE